MKAQHLVKSGVISGKEGKNGGRKMITINDNDLPITVAQKLITGTRQEENSELGVILQVNMYTLEEIKEIAKYLLTYDLCHPNGD